MPTSPVVYSSYAGTVANDATDGDVAWTNPTNAQASDDSRATSLTSMLVPKTQWLVGSNFTFTDAGNHPIPDNGLLVGLKMTVEGYSALAASAWETVRIGEGVGSWDGDDKAAGVLDIGSDGDHVFGSATDDWSTTLPIITIRDALEIGLRVNRNAQASVTSNIDSILIDLYIQPPQEPRGRGRGESGIMARDFRSPAPSASA